MRSRFCRSNGVLLESISQWSRGARIQTKRSGYRLDFAEWGLPSRISSALCRASVIRIVLLERGTPGHICSAASRMSFRFSGDKRTLTCNDLFESFIERGDTIRVSSLTRDVVSNIIRHGWYRQCL
jgi:hypothetical protein